MVSYEYNEETAQKYNHQAHNELILEKIKRFQEANNLDPSEFVIGGSSAASYMNYFVIKRVNDIDIYIDKPDLIHTGRIDTIKQCWICNSNYQSRVVEKDGYFFLSPEDLLLTESLGAIVKLKINNVEYCRRMLRYLNLSVDDFLPTVLEAIEQSPVCSLDNGQEWKINAQKRADRLLRKWCENQNKEIMLNGQIN